MHYAGIPNMDVLESGRIISTEGIYNKDLVDTTQCILDSIIGFYHSEEQIDIYKHFRNICLWVYVVDDTISCF